MRKYIKKLLILAVVSILCFNLLAGCGEANKPVEPKETTTAGSSADTQASTQASSTEELKKITLTQLTAADTDTDPLTGGDPNKKPWAIEAEKRTGVHIDHIVVPGEDYDTKMNLLISSGDIPDLFSLPSNYPGGAVKAAEDGVIAKISDYWEEFAPNLKRVVESNPEWEKELKADNGEIYGFPCIREDKSIVVFFGPIIRKDLLNAAGLELPETIDEWHTALTAFKQAGVKNPFSAVSWFYAYSGAFVGAYGATGAGESYSIVPGQDGKMHYGPTMPGYKEFLKTFNQWYKEGLIDPDYFTLEDWAVLATKVTSGQAGSYLHFLGTIDKYTAAGKENNPNFELAATKYPVLKKGDTPIYGQRDPVLGAGGCISAKSKYVKEAVKYLDYGYTPEGQLLYNFGIEGESYTLDASGKPVYTELIKATPKNSKGWTQGQALLMYCPAAGDYFTIQQKSYFEQVRLVSDAQKKAVELWSEPLLSSLQPGFTLTKAETMVAKKLSNVETYAEEMTAKFIMGRESIDNFDKFVEQCKQLGVDDVVEVYNDALVRYNNR